MKKEHEQEQEFFFLEVENEILEKITRNYAIDENKKKNEIKKIKRTY